MSVLLLRFAGPLQSWGVSSRYARREAGREPSKSGIVGLIAAAEGRRRTDPIEDLAQLRIGVRSDQPGRLVRDYQTARHPSWPNAMLSTRYYLGDAVFLAAVSADESILAGIHVAIRSPAFPLYLGRRACPPSGPISLGIRSGSVEDALANEPWIASEWWQRKSATAMVWLGTTIDSDDGAGIGVQDAPVSFDQERREYVWRNVKQGRVEVANPHARSGAAGSRFGALDAWGSVGA